MYIPYSNKNHVSILNQVVGVVVVTRTGMPAVTDSEHGNYFITVFFSFFLFGFFFKSLFLFDLD